MDSIDVNIIKLAGTVAQPPVFSHEAHGHAFYTMTLSAERLSGSFDLLRVQLPQELAALKTIAEGERAAFRGHVRSFNNRSGTGSKLVLSALAREWIEDEGEDLNELELTGTLCKPPIYRKTPLGREISDLLVASSRGRGRSDYLPCITWGAAARRMSELTTGNRVSIKGRMQSRNYSKLENEVEQRKTAYEISVAEILAI
ncbi:single-strand DNA-binding protein [Clostridia bacterium]|nr:single-strand DNA-binding protein [Clostridia bacterium]